MSESSTNEDDLKITLNEKEYDTIIQDFLSGETDTVIETEKKKFIFKGNNTPNNNTITLSVKDYINNYNILSNLTKQIDINMDQSNIKSLSDFKIDNTLDKYFGGYLKNYNFYILNLLYEKKILNFY